MFVEIGKNLYIISENINLDEILNNKVEFDCICKLDSPFKTDTYYGFSYPNYISACKGLAYID